MDTEWKTDGSADHSFVPAGDLNKRTFPADDDVELRHDVDASAGTHQPLKSNSHDDFEHIMTNVGSAASDPDFDLLGGVGGGKHFVSPPTASQLAQNAADLLGDFKAQDDHFHKAATIDFMAAERQIAASHSPPAVPAARTIDFPVAATIPDEPPAASLKTSIYDDFENDYLKPKPKEVARTEAASEKFISSEDLLGDFDQHEEIKSAANKSGHSAVEDILVHDQPAKVEPVVEAEVKPAAPAPVKPNAVEPVPVARPAAPAPVKEVPVPTSKPKDAPPQPPAKKEAMILADEIFYKIGLGEFIHNNFSAVLHINLKSFQIFIYYLPCVIFYFYKFIYFKHNRRLLC